MLSILAAVRRSRPPPVKPVTIAMSRPHSTAPPAKKAPMVPKPSSSIMVLSPTNQLLLLHRVQTSTSFPSAHVFPGGNLSKFHEAVPAEDANDRHRDSEAYRLGAIRETFEEAGILLAKKDGGRGDLVELSPGEVEEARKKIHGNKVRFGDWVESVGGTPDVGGLIPFTRWVTPPNVPKRFTTQMYVYMLPLGSSIAAERDASTVVHTPTHDGGIEHTAAAFDDVSDWLARQARGEIILFPPQLYLLTLLGQFLTGPGDYAAQREALLDFLNKTPTGPGDHPTASIPWAEKVISPVGLGIKRADGRNVLSLEGPGKEVKTQDSSRAGDHARVVLVKPTKRGPSEVEIIWRSDLGEEANSAKVDYEVVVSKHPSRDPKPVAAKL